MKVTCVKGASIYLEEKSMWYISMISRGIQDSIIDLSRLYKYSHHSSLIDILLTERQSLGDDQRLWFIMYLPVPWVEATSSVSLGKIATQ